jgi:hypothetical protein
MISRINLLKITLAAMFLVLITLSFFFANPEKEVTKKVLGKGCTAIETGNLKAVMSLISLSYHDDLGFNSGALRGSFGYTFSELKNIKVEYRTHDFKIRKDTCVVEIDVRVKGLWTTANRETFIAGADSGYEKVFIICKKESGGWKVVSTKWPDRKDSVKMFG